MDGEGLFWRDLAEDQKDPEFAREFAAESERIADVDAAANQTWWIVLNPTPTRELLAVLVKPDGERVHTLMGPVEKQLVTDMAAHAWSADPTVDLSVAHGWAQAPEGLREAYEAKQGPRR